MDRSGTPDSASSSDPSRPVTRRRTAFWIAATIVVIAVAALAAGGARAVPPWLTGKIERIVSDTLGRELRLDGPLEISLGTEPTLVAKGVTLANAAWGSEAAMVRVDRVELTLSLRSLWSPPIRVLNLDLEGARGLASSRHVRPGPGARFPADVPRRAAGTSARGGGRAARGAARAHDRHDPARCRGSLQRHAVGPRRDARHAGRAVRASRRGARGVRSRRERVDLPVRPDPRSARSRRSEPRR